MNWWLIMNMKDQWKKIKNNWLIIVLIVVLLIFINLGSVSDISYQLSSGSRSFGGGDYELNAVQQSGKYFPAQYDDFSPEIEERKIIKTASISTEVKKAGFESAEQHFKDIILSSESYILNENVDKFGSKRKEYFQGRYQIKVETTKYASVISQLKNIGEVQSFNENAQDITGQYSNIENDIKLEKSKLERYLELYSGAKKVEDKLNINDRIFNQERRIKYLEDSINNLDQKIEYSTIQFTLTEKQSKYADVSLAKLSLLVKNFVVSFNALLQIIFITIPWIVFISILGLLWKIIKKRL